MKRVMLVIMMCMILCSFATAAEETLGTFKEGENVLLVQLCGTCTYNNITSVTNPNSTEMISNVAMTQDGTKYTYNLAGGNVTELGKYKVNGVGDLGGVHTAWVYSFEVTGTGEEFTTAKVIYYGLILAVLVFFFFLSMMAFAALPGSNTVDEGGLMNINKLKYFKGVFIGLCWGILLTINFTIYGVAEAYFKSHLVSDVFFMFFTIQMWSTMVALPLWIMWFFVKIAEDKDLKRKMERGLM